MLKRLKISNYRCFRDHEVTLRPTTVIVGRNNAGKSTLIEALRLVALTVDRFRHLSYREPPSWTDLPRVDRGISPSIEGIEFNAATVFHRYGDPPATVHASFEGRRTVQVHVGPDGAIFAVIRGPNGRAISNKSQALALTLPTIAILPQIGPLERQEKVLTEEYVRGNLGSHLASRHFRNQLHLLRGAFSPFRELAHTTWPGLRIDSFDAGRGHAGEPLTLLVRDGNFVAEVGCMGHGLQMWLQTIWFLSRASTSGTIILDEPDVYMHPDLQRRLIRVLLRRGQQVLVATHSIEIMSEVEASNVLVIDHSRAASGYAGTSEEIQGIIDRLGGIHNVHLARLSAARRCVLTEGDDLGILKRIQDRLWPQSEWPLDIIPNAPIGGWGGWQYAVGSSLILTRTSSRSIMTYCLLDRDYHTDAQVAERYREADARDVELHVWSKKELENYLLQPAAIWRCLQERAAGREVVLPTVPEIAAKTAAIVESMQDETMDKFAETFAAEDRPAGTAAASRKAREHVRALWQTRSLDLVSGKEVIARLSTWCQEACGTSLSIPGIIAGLDPEEIAPEIRDVLRAIVERKKVPR